MDMSDAVSAGPCAMGVSVFCSECGASNPVGRTHCGECGARLSSAYSDFAAPADEARETADPTQATPPSTVLPYWDDGGLPSESYDSLGTTHCRYCGAGLRADDVRCPVCGASARGDAGTETEKPTSKPDIFRIIGIAFVVLLGISVLGNLLGGLTETDKKDSADYASLEEYFDRNPERLEHYRDDYGSVVLPAEAIDGFEVRAEKNTLYIDYYLSDSYTADDLHYDTKVEETNFLESYSKAKIILLKLILKNDGITVRVRVFEHGQRTATIDESYFLTSG